LTADDSPVERGFVGVGLVAKVGSMVEEELDDIVVAELACPEEAALKENFVDWVFEE
jgi:hypothetical protein